MSEYMKTSEQKVALIDLAPTVFGASAIIGLFTSYGSHSSLWYYTGFSPMMLYGGLALTLVTSLVSIASAKKRSSSGMIRTVNVAWLIIALLVCSIFVMAALHPLRFTF
jgi:hypothetical protein